MKCNFSTSRLAAVLALSWILAPAALAGEDLGEQLIRKFFADAKSRDMAAIEKTLAEGFQSVHTNGARDRAAEVEIIRKMTLGSTTLANFETTRNGSVLVVTFEVDAPGEILMGKQVGEGSHPRMAVWVETGGAWQLIAYANLAPLH